MGDDDRARRAWYGNMVFWAVIAALLILLALYVIGTLAR
jgi:hypothetical protein